jgi:hypothetical protein
MNDLRVMRERQLDMSAALDATGDLDTYAQPALVIQTTTVSTYPAAAAEYYACNPVQLSGPETEGATPTFTVDTSTTLFALNLGTQIPPNGTYLVIHGGSGRWSFRYDG